MYPSTKFQSIWRTSDFETKFAQRNMTDKNYEKINIKIVISIQQSTPLWNFSHFVELQIMSPNLPKKYDWQKIWKNKHQNRNKHIAIYLCTKFQPIWRISDFGIKFAQNI